MKKSLLYSDTDSVNRQKIVNTTVKCFLFLQTPQEARIARDPMRPSDRPPFDAQVLPQPTLSLQFTQNHKIKVFLTG